MNNMINFQIIRQVLNRKAVNLQSLDFIFRELATRVISRLDYIKIKPNIILECGSGLGFDRELLSKRFQDASIIEMDVAIEILKQHNSKTHSLVNLFRRTAKRNLICGDAQSLPIATSSVDFAYSNLLLPYLADVSQYIREMERILKVGGAFCIAGFGVDTFKEIREMGFATYTFPDMHDIGDMLLARGFSNPVVDTEYITLQYDDLKTLLADIRLIGCGAAINTNDRKIVAKSRIHALGEKFSPADLGQFTVSPIEPLKLTLEMFVAHGWKDKVTLDLPKGQSVINFMPKRKA